MLAELSRPIGAGTTTLSYYYHTDALGSPIAKTNASGTVIERTKHEPYGLADRPNDDRVGYTGHVMDSASGLTYMQQRYYDPQIGRFLSVDPVTAYSSPIGAFNRYKYAANNPYRFLDPDGRYECTATGKGQCARLEKAVARIHKAAEKAPEGSRVAQVSQLLGAPGEKNGVVISGQLADPKNLGEATSADGKGVHIGLNFGKLKTGDQLASVTMHEGSHGVDQRDPNLGPRMRDVSRSALEVTELKASTAQARMFEALKANEPYKLFSVDGGMNWKGINEQADRSVEWACPNKNSCNP